MAGSVKVVLYKSKTYKNGEHPVMLRVTRAGKQSYVTLGASSLPKDWDDKISRPKKTHPTYAELIRLCDEKETTARAEMLNAVRETNTFTAEKIIETVAIKLEPEKSLVIFFDKVIARLITANRLRYASTFRDTKSHLVSMMARDPKNPTFSFSDLTPTFLADWEAKMIGKGYKNTTISLYLRTLRVLCNYARAEGAAAKNFKPFDEFKITKYGKVQTEKRSITPEDIAKLGAVKLPVNSDDYHAQQLFLFTYYCWGINYMDVAYLTKDSVRETPEGLRLRYKRHKTQDPFDILLLEPARAIWEHYLTRKPPRNKYVWPILHSEVHVLPGQIDNRLHRCNRNWNKALRRVAKQAGVDEYLTLYVARHSFATSMKNGGASIAVISEMMGHETEQTTQIYLRQFPQSTLDNAAGVLLGGTKKAG